MSTELISNLECVVSPLCECLMATWLMTVGRDMIIVLVWHQRECHSVPPSCTILNYVLIDEHEAIVILCICLSLSLLPIRPSFYLIIVSLLFEHDSSTSLSLSLSLTVFPIFHPSPHPFNVLAASSPSAFPNRSLCIYVFILSLSRTLLSLLW